jgi:multiple antibiotic resistance protein
LEKVKSRPKLNAMAISQYIQIFTAILVIVNPIGAIPVFVSLTGDQSPAKRKQTVQTAAITVAIVLTVTAFVGEMILRFFGISMESFRIASGILLLLMALAMLHAKQSSSKHSPEEAEEAASQDNIAVVPLAIPLMTGPAAMSTVIVYVNKTSGWFDTGFIVASCLVVALIVWVALRLATPIASALGRTGMNIVTRVMGLLLAAIAVEFITSGLRELFPGLMGGSTP